MTLTTAQRVRRNGSLGGATESIPWNPSQWSNTQMHYWFHGGVPDGGLASTIQGGVGNTATGWNDGSGNSRHVSGTINGTPNVVQSGSLEGINFARADAEYLLQTSYNAPSDTAGTWWFVFRPASAIAEGAAHFLCGWGASGSGTKYSSMMLETSGGNLGPKFLSQKNSGVQSSQGPQLAATIVGDTVYTLAFEADQTGTTWRMWLNESLVATTDGGTVGCWWQLINADSQLNRFAIGTAATNSGVSTNYWNGHIYEIGEYKAVLGADETNFLAYLTRQRGFA